MCDCEKCDGCHEKSCTGRMKPYTFVSNAADGYLQAKEGIYYKGSAYQIGDSGDKIYFALANPEGSHKNLVINRITIANLGDDDIVCSLILCGRPCKRMKPSDHDVNTNGRFCKEKSSGMVLYDKDVYIEDGSIAETFVIKSEENITRDINGSIIVPSFKFCLIQAGPLTSGSANATCSFDWWEEDCR